MSVGAGESTQYSNPADNRAYTLTRPIQQSDLIRAALTRLEIGQHSQRVKNLTPRPYARGGGASTRGEKAKGRRQKAEGKNADFFT